VGVSLITAALFTVTGCVSSQFVDAGLKAERKNPHSAVEYLASALEEDYKNSDAIDALNSTMASIRANYEDLKLQAKRSGNFEIAVAECDRMIATAKVISSIPGRKWALNFNPGERVALANKAAEKYYRIGVKYQNEKRYKQAIVAIDRSRGFVSDYKDSTAIRTELEQHAVERMYVIAKDYSQDSKKVVACNVAEKLCPYLLEKAPRFVKIVSTPEQASVFCEMAINTAQYKDSGEIAKKDQRTETYREYDSSGKSRKKTRSVRWVHYKRTTGYDLHASLSLHKAADKSLIKSETAKATEKDMVQWATYSGDKEALPSGISKLPNSEVAPKDKEVLINSCVDEVSKSLATKLFLHYK